MKKFSEKALGHKDDCSDEAVLIMNRFWNIQKVCISSEKINKNNKNKHYSFIKLLDQQQ